MIRSSRNVLLKKMYPENNKKPADYEQDFGKVLLIIMQLNIFNIITN